MARLKNSFGLRRLFLILPVVFFVFLGVSLCILPLGRETGLATFHDNRVTVSCNFNTENKSSVNGVILILLGQRRSCFVFTMLPMLNTNFLSRYPYPVHIFYEDLSEKEKRIINDAIPSATRVEFEDVSRFWRELPAGVSEQQLEDWMRTPTQRKLHKRGYRIMCRFWAGLVWQLPSLDAYDYYWRLDDDSFLTTPVPCDVFQVMISHQCNYAYRLIMKEATVASIDLWPTFLRWAHSKLSVSEISDIKDIFVTGNESLGKKKFRPFMYFNNFEIGSMALKRHPLYKSMFRFLDEEEPHGIMRYRWGDAPIHTLGVEVVLRHENWKKCEFNKEFAGYLHTSKMCPSILQSIKKY